MTSPAKTYGTVATRNLGAFKGYAPDKSPRVNGRGNLNIAHRRFMDTLTPFRNLCREIRGADGKDGRNQ